MENKAIQIVTEIEETIQKIWELWTSPKHIIRWNTASPEWHTTQAENDLRVGGRFTSRMEAKDGSMGFDFGGTYDEIITHKRIKYTLDDDRKVDIIFEKLANVKIRIIESFEPESTHSREMQQQGWQAILDNFKKYVEQHK